MDTNKLINDLTQNLTPVRPVGSAPLRAMLFILMSAIFLSAGLYLAGGPRPDLAFKMAEFSFLLENAAMTLAGLLATLAAFRLHVPDTRLRKNVILPLSLGSALWLLIAFHCCLGISPTHALHQFREEASLDALHCATDLALLVTAPLISALLMLRRAAPVWHGWLGYATALSLASFGAVGTRLLCDYDVHAHLILWHFLPVFIMAFVGSLIGQGIKDFKKKIRL